MIQKIIFILIMSIYSYGCALCSIDLPVADVDINASVSDGNITSIEFVLKYNDNFTKETLLMFDDNKNKILEDREINIFKKDFFSYVDEQRHFTTMKYYDKNDEEKIKYHILRVSENKKIDIVDSKIRFSYLIRPDFEIEKNKILSIAMKDESGYFTFKITNVIVNGINVNVNSNNNVTFIELLDTNQQSVVPQVQNDTQPVIKELSYIEKLNAQIHTLLEDVKNNNSALSYLWLFGFSFLYGMLHAIGPGHGKSLVASYFLSGDKEYTKAISVSFMIGIVHTFSAFLLTLVVYYILNTYLSKYFSNIEYVAIKISAMIIILIALYMIYKKLYKKPIVKSFVSSQTSFSLAPNVSHSIKCGCASCKVEGTDYWLIISAGIVPCAGTVTVFIFTMSMGIYFVGFLSALFMSFGMSIVIFLSASLSIVARKSIEKKTTKLTKVLEYFSLIFVLGLGIFLLLA